VETGCFAEFTGKRNKMNRKIDLYEEVRIMDSAENTELQGKIGVVLGISEEDGIVQSYAVDFDDLPYVYSVSANCVIPTGRKFKREDFYDGTSISVSQDGELLPPK